MAMPSLRGGVRAVIARRREAPKQSRPCHAAGRAHGQAARAAERPIPRRPRFGLRCHVMNVHAETSILLRQRQGDVAVLVLNRPAARNSLSESLIAALAAAFADIARDPATRAVVLAANGPAFSAGHDLKELTAHRSDADG